MGRICCSLERGMKVRRIDWIRGVKSEILALLGSFTPEKLVRLTSLEKKDICQFVFDCLFRGL